MAGRARKDRTAHLGREPLKDTSAAEMRKVVDLQRRRKLVDAMAKSQHAENAAGLLYLEGFLSEAELHADIRFAALVRRYCAVTGLPQAVTRAMDLDGQTGRALQEDPTEDEIAAIRRRYSEAWRALTAAGRPAFTEVNRVTILGQACADRHALKRGLAALTAVFQLGEGMTRGQRKRARMRARMKDGARPVISAAETAE
ncbi:MAG: hypothetical protein AAF441_04305 [Pseudomonadota bacterium]